MKSLLKDGMVVLRIDGKLRLVLNNCLYSLNRVNHSLDEYDDNLICKTSFIDILSVYEIKNSRRDVGLSDLLDVSKIESNLNLICTRDSSFIKAQADVNILKRNYCYKNILEASKED